MLKNFQLIFMIVLFLEYREQLTKLKFYTQNNLK